MGTCYASGARPAGRPAFPPTPWDGKHDAILAAYPPWRGTADGQFMYDFLGVRTSPRFRRFYSAQPMGELITEYPRPDQTYFELTEILRATAEHPERDFTFMELGGAYGHWSVKAAAARKLKSTGPVHLVVVEMEPVRFSWMEQHFRSNGLEPPDHELLNAAVSDHTGEASYPSGPEGQEDYGLSLCRGLWRSKLHSPDEPGKSGSEVRVRCVRLSDLLHRWPRVDLVHLDVQGEEWALLREARAL